MLHVVLTVQQDTRDDLLLNSTAANGTGWFVVMEGGSIVLPWPLRNATVRARINATHPLLTLDAALVNASSSRLLFYPTAQLGSGTATR